MEPRNSCMIDRSIVLVRDRSIDWLCEPFVLFRTDRSTCLAPPDQTHFPTLASVCVDSTQPETRGLDPRTLKPQNRNPPNPQTHNFPSQPRAWSKLTAHPRSRFQAITRWRSGSGRSLRW
eukprot:143715-Rhodomonas_salina.4